MFDPQAARERREAAMLSQLTEEERADWLRGYPYSAKFTQGMVHRLPVALEALEEAHKLLRRLRAAHENRGGACVVCCVPWPCQDVADSRDILGESQ